MLFAEPIASHVMSCVDVQLASVAVETLASACCGKTRYDDIAAAAWGSDGSTSSSAIRMLLQTAQAPTCAPHIRIESLSLLVKACKHYSDDMM